jgi:DNA-binding NarL/FixJ family response regulator
MSKLRLFLVDDHAVVREGLKALLTAHPQMEVVGEASDGELACTRVPRLCPDVVVMDLSMPGLTGCQATARLTQECPAARVLVLTVHEDRGYLRQLLSAGAAGYVLKRSAPEELITAVLAVAAGRVYLDPSLAGQVVGGFVKKATDTTVGSPELSEREERVARQTAAGHSNKEIAAQLELSIKTVETYRARALEKLGLRTRADLVRYAVQQGWLLDG